GPAEMFEGARPPVLRRDARLVAAPCREPGEGLLGERHLAGEVAHPGCPPARFGREVVLGKAVGELRVARARLVVAAGLLRDAADRVEGRGGLRAVREAAHEVAEETERARIVVPVPAPGG